MSSLTEAYVRNRFGREPDVADVQSPSHIREEDVSAKQQKSRSTEEILIEKLDRFLSSIEQRLDRFDQYFKVTGGDTTDEEEEEQQQQQEQLKSDSKVASSRRSSSASLSSIKSFSIYNLNKVYEQLGVVKDQVLKTSVLNLEYLYKALDDKYNYLFNQDGDYSCDTAAGSSSTVASNRELLANKIITNLTYFEQKLSHIDSLIKSKTPSATADYDSDAKFNQFRFYNFNKAIRTAQHKYLHYYQLPLSWRENRYIMYGYRFNLSHREMLKSIFHFNHNETGNIWTHVLGAALIVYFAFIHFPSTAAFAANSAVANAMMYIFLAAAFDCLASSVLWHTYSCFAQLKIRNRFACVDYTGITVLITCSVIAAEYCALQEYTRLLYTFVGMSALFGAAGFLVNWSPYFDRPECRPLRIGFFVSLVVLGASTFLCKWYLEGFMSSFYFFSPLFYKSLVWYWVGVLFYGGLIPERFRYDIVINDEDSCNHSHSASDILTGNIEHSGEEELREMKAEMEHSCEVHGRSAEKSEPRGFEVEPAYEQAHVGSQETSTPSCGGVDYRERSWECACQPAHDDETLTNSEILTKHFPEEPTPTPYRRDFFSLWWVDYAFSSHNIWHFFVVLGVIGHYSCLIGMFDNIHKIAG